MSRQVNQLNGIKGKKIKVRQYDDISPNLHKHTHTRFAVKQFQTRHALSQQIKTAMLLF